ncbi:hypothetical protein SCUCBS95973_005068 [Sporothrix curviconia]|uniref:Uncharacterized protein n=1 Tax=Sporothrix curviconia TaxID=1260050 RepID=A0ABP0BVU1_9PEZI
MSSRDRRKSEKNAPVLVTLTVSPDKLRAIFPDLTTITATSITARETETTSASTPLLAKDSDDSDVKPSTKDDNASESTPATPQGNKETAAGTTANTPSASQSSAANMAPPHATTTADEDGGAATKKKGVKRSAAAAGVDSTPSAGPGSANGDTPAPAARVRSKPGPKKKAKLDDGVEIRASASGAHKLGPKASMGAINAGLRALDRSGKPCRKWVKGGFQLKSFTGVQWEIPRWRAPQKPSASDDSANGTGEECTSAATPSADGSGSNKENGGGNIKDKKDGPATNGEAKTNGHTNGVNGETATATPSDVDMTNAPTSAVASPSVEPATEAATPVAAAA